MTNITTRDARGWRVPREGTKSAKIYALMVEGKSTQQIAGVVGGRYNTICVLSWKIRHPDMSNASSYKSWAST